jgi:hypothetical protein
VHAVGFETSAETRDVLPEPATPSAGFGITSWSSRIEERSSTRAGRSRPARHEVGGGTIVDRDPPILTAL